MGQALAAERRIAGERHPTGLDKSFVGFLESSGRANGTVLEVTAFLVAGLVQGLQHLFAELGGLGEDRRDDVGGGVGKAGKIRIAFDVEHIAQQELHVVNRCLVGRHGASPNCGMGARLHRRI